MVPVAQAIKTEQGWFTARQLAKAYPEIRLVEPCLLEGLLEWRDEGLVEMTSTASLRYEVRRSESESGTASVATDSNEDQPATPRGSTRLKCG